MTATTAKKTYPTPTLAVDQEITSITIGRTVYRVERTDQPRAPYALFGKRGAVIGLFRNINHPDQLFTVNPTAMGAPTVWFRELNGKLVRIGG